MDRKNKRVVNLRYMVDGLHFDAAIDCDWCLHAYDLFHKAETKDETPIELYCIDHKEWDIRMMYYKEPNNRDTNDQQDEVNIGGIYNTCVGFEEILKETKAWIEEMKNINEEIIEL